MVFAIERQVSNPYEAKDMQVGSGFVQTVWVVALRPFLCATNQALPAKVGSVFLYTKGTMYYDEATVSF